MKFICLNESCGKLFMYPVKIVQSKPTVRIGTQDVYFEGVKESHVCPYCSSLDIEEYTPEPAPQPQITSVVSVELAQVDAKLAEGYVVRELYAKTATLVKMEAKQA